MVQIKALAGMSAEETLTLRDPGTIPRPPDVSGDAVLGLAIANRADLKAARLQEAMDEAEIAVAKAEATPNITASAGYVKENRAFEAPAPLGQKLLDHENLLSFGFSIPLPLFNRQQGNIAEAVSLQSQARAKREALEQSIRRDALLALEKY